MGKIGVMVCGHGSRDMEAITEFQSVAAGIATRLPQYPVASGFLEFAKPIIREGLDKLHQQGADHILAVPVMLFAAGHVKNDIPSVLNTYAVQHPGLRIDYGRDLSVDTRLLERPDGSWTMSGLSKVSGASQPFGWSLYIAL